MYINMIFKRFKVSIHGLSKIMRNRFLTPFLFSLSMFRLFICRNQKNDSRAKNPQCVQRKKVFLISNFCVCKTWIKLWLVMLQNAFAYSQPPNLDFRLLQISFLFATCMNWKWYIVMIFENFFFFSKTIFFKSMTLNTS